MANRVNTAVEPGAHGVYASPAGLSQPLTLTVVLPAYNEEAAIGPVVVEHAAVLETLSPIIADWEILCVDDASTDRTLDILVRLQQSITKLRVLHHSENQGIHASFAHLYREAKGSLIYSTGADGQWPAEHLKRLLEPLLGEADLVVGVRTNLREIYGPLRRLTSFAYNWLPRLIFRVAIRDAGSIKLGRREIFAFEMISRSVFAEAERIIRAHREGWKVAFVPIDFRPRSTGRATGGRWKNIIASVRDLIRCVWEYGAR